MPIKLLVIPRVLTITSHPRFSQKGFIGTFINLCICLTLRKYFTYHITMTSGFETLKFIFSL